MNTEQTDLVVAIARSVEGEVEPGWDSLRYEADAVGNLTSDLIYVMRAGAEERAYAAREVRKMLKVLKKTMYTAEGGTWVSFSLMITAADGLKVDYNYDDKPDFGFEVSAHDYNLELERFPRPEGSVPAWWRERILLGDGEDDQ